MALGVENDSPQIKAIGPRNESEAFPCGKTGASPWQASRVSLWIILIILMVFHVRALCRVSLPDVQGEGPYSQTKLQRVNGVVAASGAAAPAILNRGRLGPQAWTDYKIT